MARQKCFHRILLFILVCLAIMCDDDVHASANHARYDIRSPTGNHSPKLANTSEWKRSSPRENEGKGVVGLDCDIFD